MEYSDDVLPPRFHQKYKKNVKHLMGITNLRFNISELEGILIVNKMTEPTKIKLGVLVLFGALFMPIAAQAGGVPGTFSSPGTVTIGNPCPTDTSTVTSVQAQSVLLILDTATVAIDTSNYHYYTETNTALWGATYEYGSTQKPDCSYRDMSGTMVLTRGPFIASSGAQYSETSTIGANLDFIQYVGNLNLTGSAWSHTNNCGNTTVPNLNVANPCDFTNAAKQQNWPQVNTGTSQLIRSGGIRSGTSLAKTGTFTTPEQAATVFVIVKAKKTTVALAPTNTSWVSTETFTVTSA